MKKLKQFIAVAFLIGSSLSFAQEWKVDTSFNMPVLMDGFSSGGLSNFYIQPDGKIIITGQFNTVNGVVKNRMARLNADGSLDASFDVGDGFMSSIYHQPYVSKITFQPDGKIIAWAWTYGGSLSISSGETVTFNGIPLTSNMARLNTDGTLDTSFNPSGQLGTHSLSAEIALVQPDGKILVSRSFDISENGIIRLNSDGTLDASFNDTYNFIPYDPVNMIPARMYSYGTGAITMVLQADGKIIVRNAPLLASANAYQFARLNTDGSLDHHFGDVEVNNTAMPFPIVLQPDGKVLVRCENTTYNGTPVNGIIRINSDGTLDTSFDTGVNGLNTNGQILSHILLPDGKIIVFGHFTIFNNTPATAMVQINTDGTVDTSFNVGTGFAAPSGVGSPTMLPDGKIMFMGGSNIFNGTAINGITRLYTCTPVSSIDTVEACDSYTWIDGNTYTESNNTAAYVFPNGAANGCDSIVTLNLTITNPSSGSNELCLVTNSNGKNLLVWEKTGANNIGYRIYKQNNQTSQYEFIYEQPFDSLSEFLDQNSSPSSSIDRYKISLVNACGTEGAQGPNHTTILLTSSLGTNDNVNLNWNAYEGFTYSNFKILRSIDGQNYNPIATVANNTFSYIDNNPNSESYYKIVVEPVSGCTSTEISEHVFTPKTDYFSVESNIVDREGNPLTPLSVKEFAKNNFILYPNPTKNTLHIQSEQPIETVRILSVNGMEVLMINNTENIEVSGLSAGYYLVEVNGSSMNKFVKE